MAGIHVLDAWQEEIARAVRDELKKAGRQILISGQEAFSYTPRHTFPQDKGLGGWLLDIVNVHPLPNTIFEGHAYELGAAIHSLRLAKLPAPNPRRQAAAEIVDRGSDLTQDSVHRYQRPARNPIPIK